MWRLGGSSTHCAFVCSRGHSRHAPNTCRCQVGIRQGEGGRWFATAGRWHHNHPLAGSATSTQGASSTSQSQQSPGPRGQDSSTSTEHAQEPTSSVAADPALTPAPAPTRAPALAPLAIVAPAAQAGPSRSRVEAPTQSLPTCKRPPPAVSATAASANVLARQRPQEQPPLTEQQLAALLRSHHERLESFAPVLVKHGVDTISALAHLLYMPQHAVRAFLKRVVDLESARGNTLTAIDRTLLMSALVKMGEGVV
ncbi:hypothetical protein ACM66B_005286 [Microbotryomycetes sp. NB124-2]